MVARSPWRVTGGQTSAPTLAPVALSLTDRLKPVTPPALRRKITSARHGARSPTSSWRALPDFLVIGAQRAGTSSLYKYLGSHPEIAPSLRKEVGYLSRWYGAGLPWYQAHFPLRLRRRVARALGRDLQSFEATPDYLLHPLAASRAARLLPDARLVVLLREPVARAWSHYQHMVRLGFEHLTFEEALAGEEERIAEDLVRVGQHPAHDPKHLLRFSYAARGQYAPQLEAWLLAYPRERLLVLDSAELYADPAAIYARILAFLGLHPWAPGSFPNYSALSPGVNAEGPSERARGLLEEYFAASNAALPGLLGGPLSWT